MKYFVPQDMNESLKFYGKLKSLSGEEYAKKKLYSMWNKMTIEALTYQKYIKKDQEADNE